MFSLRLFLLNHSPVYAWRDLPGDLRQCFPEPNVMLLHAECFVADPRRRLYRFELMEAGVGESAPVRHRADVVIMQSWGLMTLVRYGVRPESPARFVGLRDTVIVSAAYVARRQKQ
jgi:hypothetical protein